MSKRCRDCEKLEMKIAHLKATILTILDQVDYTKDACSATDMVGAVLPSVIIENARKEVGKI